MQTQFSSRFERAGWLSRGTILLLFLISARSSPGQELRSEKIYAWGFFHSEDKDSDLWPDQWQRRQDRIHPDYIEMRIQPKDAAKARDIAEAKNTLIRIQRAYETGRWDPNYVPETTPPNIAEFLDRTVLDNCIEIRMDGGAAELISPKFPLDPRYSHRLACDLSSEELDGHLAWVELQLLDQHENIISTLKSNTVEGTQAWFSDSAQADALPMGSLRSGRIHLKVEPHKSLHIAGVARFDNLAIYRMPRLALTTDLEMNLAEPGQSFGVKCIAMGIKNDVSTVEFQLLDAVGKHVQRETVDLQKTQVLLPTERLVSKNARTSEKPTYVVNRSSTSETSDGQATWHLKIDRPGLYRLQAGLGKSAGRDQRRTVLLAVMNNNSIKNAGPFGWSIPSFGPHLAPSEIPSLATRFGAGWVKFPIWFDMTDTEAADELVALTERLQAYRIKCVGLLGSPPAAQQDNFDSGGAERLHAITIFRETNVWEPLLEPVLTRMGMRLTWFQLGVDDDLSFMGSDNAVEQLMAIRGRMQTYCQELKIVLGWDWLEQPPQDGRELPWDAVHFRTNPQLTAAEFESYTKSAKTRNQETWVNIDPLPTSKYKLLDRVRDLTERMVEVHREGIPAAFLTNPFDAETGLFTDDRMAGEMLIPWTTLVKSMGDRRYAGSIKLPSGSTNHIFADGSEGVMIAWNMHQTEERIFLGNEVTATDIWGSPLEVETVANEQGGEEQVVSIGKWPVMIHGVNVDIVRWRQQFRLGAKRLASRVGGGQLLPIVMTNPFDQTLSGKVQLVCGTLLADRSSNLAIQIGGGRSQPSTLPVTVKADASAGRHQLRFDFEIEADQVYRFSAYREIELGMGKVQFMWDATRKGRDQVLLRIDVQNNTESPVSFDCKIFPPGSPYERFQVIQAPTGNSSKELSLNLPSTGQRQEYWIRCEGIGTGILLNYRIKF